MFKQLRNRFIITNLIITTVILIIAFAVIYFVVSNITGDRVLIPEGSPSYTTDVANIIIERVQLERQMALHSLLFTLIITGILVELIVAGVSYYLAEESIKPIREAYESQKTFIANASHEMKNPLAAIAANLEAADIHDNHWIDNVNAKVATLTTLNNQLITLTKTDSATVQPAAPTTVNLPKLIKQLSDPSHAIMTRRQIRFRIVNRSPNNSRIKLNQPDFAQIYNILLDNAVKYCRTRITVTITDKQLSIANDGARIKSTDLPHIFDRFYQTDKSSDGVGLGLAIAKSLAERNHWQLTAVSNAKSTTFTLKLTKI